MFFITYGLAVVQLALCLVTDRWKGDLPVVPSHDIQEDQQLLVENDLLEEEPPVLPPARPSRKDPESVATILSLLYNFWFLP